GLQPKGGLPEDEADLDKIFSGAGDLAYTLSFEVLPQFEVSDFSKIKLEKPVTPVTDSDIDQAIDLLRAPNPLKKPKAGAADNGDRLTVDFVGKIDGEAFEGGSTENA